MTGYSATPLVKKLGIKEGARVTLVTPPRGFRRELGRLPAKVTLLPSTGAEVDVILLFVKSEAELGRHLQGLAANITPAGMLWVAWPKKSAGVATDLSFGVVQGHGLRAGLVDTKVCAVNEVWSGLRFVCRLKDRPGKGGSL